MPKTPKDRLSAIKDEIAAGIADIDEQWDRMPAVGLETATASAHVTPVGGNVFADLGFESQEAAALKLASDARISGPSDT